MIRYVGYFLCCALSVQAVVIRSPQGQVDGKMEKLDRLGEVTKFLGIPYAVPPVGMLRFEPPQKAHNLTTIYDATYGRALCPQPEAYLDVLKLNRDPDVIFRADEDCLYLNVYIPGTVRRGNNLPVMVWIHGGDWQWGSGNHYDGRRLAVMGRVIVVTVNYRLGILGYLPDGTAASTLGLQDQIEALKWVRMNIWSYGGDPGMVTVFGNSAGSASISFLSSSPAAKNLFHRAISQSGLKTSSWAYDRDKRISTMQAIVMKLRRDGCRTDVHDCLRRASTDDLVRLTQYVALAVGGWTPHADGHVIPDDLEESPSRFHPRIERMIGFNTNDGGAMIEYICTLNTGQSCSLYEGISFKNVQKFIVPDIDLMTFEKIGKHYMDWYPGPRAPNLMSLRAASAFTTDWYERFPANQTATDWRLQGHKIYAYEFNVRARGFADMYEKVPWSEDAQRYDECPFIFASVTDEEDKRISQKMIEIWTAFARGDDLPWPQFDPKTSHMTITRRGFRAKSPLIDDRKQHFWRPWFTEGEFPKAESQSAGSGANRGSQFAPSLITFINIILITALTYWIQR